MNRSNSPLISVIIIFYNAEQYFREAIDSVLTQTYQNWELLLVDDGSQDSSREIAREYIRQYPERICYLAHPDYANRGMSATRNLGIQFAKGDLIAFLDADDVWVPNTLQDQAAILAAHPPAAMVYGPVQNWFSWTGDAADQGRDTIEILGVPPNSLIYPPRLFHLFLRDLAAVPSGIMVRREAIKRLGGFVDSFRGEYEDQVFCSKICLHAPVFAAGQCWYRYRQHPNSCVARGQLTGSSLDARRAFLDWLENYLAAQGIQDRTVHWTVKLEKMRYTHPRFFYFIRKNRHHLPRILRP